jgi:rubrerythrin
MGTPINADYLLRMAERIEHNGVDFYRMAASYVQDIAVSQLLLQLATMEARHERLFADMRSRLAAGQRSLELDPQSETSAYLTSLLEGKFFDIRIQPSDYLRPNDSLRDVLLTAIGLEKQTVAFYEAVKPVMSEQDRPVVGTVLREEMDHISRLTKALES